MLICRSRNIISVEKSYAASYCCGNYFFIFLDSFSFNQLNASLLNNSIIYKLYKYYYITCVCWGICRVPVLRETPLKVDLIWFIWLQFLRPTARGYYRTPHLSPRCWNLGLNLISFKSYICQQGCYSLTASASFKLEYNYVESTQDLCVSVP